MADAREQVPTGHAPIAPDPTFHGANGPGAGEVRPVKVDMGQGPPPVRTPAERPAAGGGASIVISSLLALVFGGAGAWAYERFLPRPAAEDATAAPTAQGHGQDAEARKDVAGLEDRVKDLSDQYKKLADDYKQLHARVESLPASTPAPDLGPIEEKVARVDRLSQQVEAIGQKVDPLPQKLEQYDRRISELDDRLNTLRYQETAARSRTAGGRDRQVTPAREDHASPSPTTSSDIAGSLATGAAAEPRATPADEKNEAADSALGSAESLFRKGQYTEAYAAFRNLLQSQPDDARVWYYAALSYGLATGNWDRTTQTMAEEGVAREKAGKPSKAEIDAAFNGLRRETGQEWLAFYRKRAG